jgi:hypothetical protein
MPHPVFKAMLAGTALAFALPAFAQGARASSPTEFVHMAERLKPGEWVWAPGVAPDGQVVVYVDLSHQLATVYRGIVRRTRQAMLRTLSVLANSSGSFLDALLPDLRSGGQRGWSSALSGSAPLL